MRAQLVVTEPIRVGNEDCWISAGPAKKPGFWLKYRLDYGSESPIGRQTIELQLTPETFQKDLAPARTFILSEEAAWLRERGLGTRVTCRDLLVFDANGLQDNELRFEDECVRHKAMDLVGDLALAGVDFVGQFVAHRSGHRLNAELVRALLIEGRVERGWRQSA
jgi:UDP-3-O-acyl-N-acetylglucosamine deacetylase